MWCSEIMVSLYSLMLMVGWGGGWAEIAPYFIINYFWPLEFQSQGTQSPIECILHYLYVESTLL